MDTEEQKTERDLYIPVNVMDSDDIIAGFGQMELAITAVAAAAALGISIITYIFSENIFMAIILFAVIIVTTVTLIFRDKYNESLIDKVRLVIRYSKRQKKYLYEYHNIYEGRKKNE